MHDRAQILLHVVSDEADRGERVDVVLGRRIPALSRRRARNLARAGKLRVDGHRQPPSFRVSLGQTLELELGHHEAPEPELELLAITERFVYVNKPAGIHTVALDPDEPGVLATAVARQFPECASASEDPREGGAVHRLDQPTSGVVAFARSRAAWTEAREQFKAARVAKHYLAVCERVTPCWPPELPADGLRGWIETVEPLTEFADHLTPLLGEHPFEQSLACVRIRAAIGRDGQDRSAIRLDGRRASTVVQPLAAGRDPARRTLGPSEARMSERAQAQPSTIRVQLDGDMDRWLIRLLLETGCRHQARVHLAWVGLPIVGDRVYNRPTSDSDRSGGPQAIRLHAFALDLSAVSPDEVPVFAPPPPDFWPARS